MLMVPKSARAHSIKSRMVPKSAVARERVNRAISELCTLWKGAVFNNNEVLPIHVPADEQSDGDHDRIHGFLKSPLCRMNEYSDLLDEVKFMLKHIQRHHNEVVFIKCQNPTCDHCGKHPVKAKEVFKFLEPYGMKFFSPMPSDKYPGHYCTFLEMCEKPPKEVGVLDSGMPSYIEKDLRECAYCPAYVFLSKTEKTRHIRIFHPNKYHRQSRSTKSLVHVCNFKIGSSVCGEKFSSAYQLRKHRQNLNHLKKRKARVSVRTRRIPKSSAARILKLSRLYQQEPSEDQEGGDDDQEDSEDPIQDNNGMSDQENSDQGQEDREQGQDDSDQEQEDSGQDQDRSDQENSEVRDERADDDLCVVCGLGEDKDNEEGELWVECTLCLNWTHVKCIPENYAHSHSDEDFLCPMCTCGKRRKTLK